MATPRDNDQDALLEAIAAGEILPDHPHVLALLADEAFRREVELMTGIQGALDEYGEPLGGGALDAEFDAKRESPRAAALAHRLVSECAHPLPLVPPVLWVRRLLGLAAALMIAAAVSWFWPRAPQSVRILLGEELEIVRPIGDCDAYSPLVWHFADGFAGTYRVDVFDVNGSPVGGIEALEAERWAPASAATWPNEIEWRITPYDTSGIPGDPVSGSARRLHSD